MKKISIVLASLLTLPLAAIQVTDQCSIIPLCSRLLPVLTPLPAVPYNIHLSGFIKNNAFFDSRQVEADGDGDLLLFPLPKLFDACCQDINDHGDYNILALQTRMRLVFEGPSFECAEMYGVIEGDFFGSFRITGASFLNRFELRHAFLELAFPNVRILAGQTWHPMQVPVLAPRTVSFNTGLPITVFNRSPQLRITYDADYCAFMVAAVSQVQFISDGPFGQITQYMRNAIMPNLHAQVQIPIGEQTVGFAFDGKRLVPRLVTNKNFKAHESIFSWGAMGFAEFALEPASVVIKGSYVENGTDLFLMSGYAVHSVDPETDHRTYTNTRAASAWIDAQLDYNLSPGIFVGYTKNLGANRTIVPEAQANNPEFIYGFQPLIDDIIRVSPRLVYNHNAFSVAGECEITRARYGTLNNMAQVQNPDPVTNIRLLVSMYYYFG